jgi:lipoate-protein ligase B
MCSRGYKKLFRIDLGLTAYREVWALQKQLLKARFAGRIADCLILTEHEPVITLGRGSDGDNLLVSADNLAEKNIDLCSVERGGDITFHGPGQLVAYPIIDLTHRGRDVRRYLRDLENCTIGVIDDLGLKAGVKEGLTGIWVADHKVAAIGVAVSHWITYHGIAINVNTDLDYYRLINPCGITEYPVGTVSQMVGAHIDLPDFTDRFARAFADYFHYETDAVDDIRQLIAGLRLA